VRVMIRKILRVLRVVWCPLRNPEQQLPFRYWHWMWLAVAARLLSFVALAVIIVPYYAIYEVGQAARWIGDMMDEGSRRVAVFYDACLIADRARSGWKPPPLPRIKVGLNPKYRQEHPERIP
jgi:hypothetical protein